MKTIIRIAACTSVCLAAVIQSAAVSAAEQDGWETVGRRRYYYENGEALTGEQIIDGIPYLFAPNGAQQTGWQTIGGKRYFYDSDGNAKFGWIEWRGETYYVSEELGKLTDNSPDDAGTGSQFDSYGVMKKGWTKDQDNCWHYADAAGETEIEGTVYLFDENGRLMTGWQTASDGITRYYDPELHVVQTGWIEFEQDGTRCYSDPETGRAEGLKTVEGQTYLFEKGIPLTGLQTDPDGNRRYFDPENGTMQTGFISYEDSMYYLDPESGILRTGWIELEDAVYYGKADGVLATGFTRVDTGVIYYFDADGKRGSGPVEIGGKTYLLNDKGIPMTGWYTAPNGDRYYGDNTAAALTGRQTINEKSYCFDDTGVLQTGWMTFDDSVYYAGEDGAFVTGFTRVEGIIYYFGSDGARGSGLTLVEGKYYILNDRGIPQTGWYTAPNGDKYYADNTAAAVTGKQTIGEKHYYFNSFGIMQTGWLTFGNSVYYAGTDGAFVTGFTRVDGIIYYFGTDGARGSGVTQIDGKNYILNDKGVPQTGWYTAPNGNKYYGDATALAVTGWQEIDNKGYYFYISGILAVSTTVDDFSIDANGVARAQMAVTVDNLLANTNYTPTSIFSFHAARYRYSRVENTRTVNQLISAGWDSLIKYTLQHRYGVCYHLAATYEYFCKRAGYTTRLIHATHNTGNHYWVQVLVNGVWQNYDPTYSNRNNISWDAQIAAGNYIVLGVVETYYDSRGAYTGCNYTPW